MMNSWKHLLIMLLVVAFAAFGAAACSSDDESEDEPLPQTDGDEEVEGSEDTEDPADPCADVTCDDENASCVEGECVCNEGYVDDGGSCVEETAGTCTGIVCGDNEHCEEGECVCDDGYVMEDGACVEDTTDPCYDVTCEDENASCVDGECLCNDGYILEDGVCVEEVVDPCADVTCDDENAHCEDGVCVCNDGYVDEEGVCVEQEFSHATVDILQGPFEDGTTVTQACLTCHADAATEMLDTFHWNWAGETPYMVGYEDEATHGKVDTINNFCIAIGSNEGRCTACHAGYGWKDNTFDFDNQDNIDCLVCHDNSGQYKKEPSANGGGGYVHADVDLAQAAQSVGQPTRKNCGACHFYAGGGDNVKKGDLGSNLLEPTVEGDVHMGGMDFTCQACHEATDHKIPGRGLHSVPVEGRVLCMDCHGEDPHENSQLNSHAAHVACQTCHIPAFSRQLPTKTEWYWEYAGTPNAEYTDCDAFTFEDDVSRACYDQKKGEFVWEMNVRPTIAWFDDMYERMLVGDTFDEAGTEEDPVQLAKPTATINDMDAKLYPFKVMKGTQPADADNNMLLVPHLYGTAGGETPYWGNWDWDASLQEGSTYNDLDYSGNYNWVHTEMYMAINHEIAPSDDALGCQDCHGENGLDWQALGYPIGDPMQYGGREDQVTHDHSDIPALQASFESGAAVTAVCTSCHTDAADEMLDTFHWNWRGPSPNFSGHEEETVNGKINVVNNFCIAVPSNEGRCTMCHSGYGWKTSDYDHTDGANVDCLVCHDNSGQYKKEPAANGGGGMVHADVDLTAAAMSAGPPTRKNCGLCHFYAGGGDNVKKGDLGSSLIDPTEEMDVHMGGMGFTCQRCHETTDHKIAGRSLHSVVSEGASECQDCHGDAPHEGNEQMNAHAEHVACQTCHIPAFARALPTKTEWYWEYAGTPNDEYTACDAFTFGEGDDQMSRACYDQKKGEFVWEQNVAPTIAWWNKTFDRMLIGEQFTPVEGEPVMIAEPLGDINDMTAKLYPFKVMRGSQPADAENNWLLVPHLYGTAGGDTPYWGNWDWEASLQEGADYLNASGYLPENVTYSGSYEWVETEMYMSINHEVAPSSQALGCMDCHGVFDWEALGYPLGDPMSNGGREAQLAGK